MPQGDKHRLSAKKRQDKKCQTGRLAFCLAAFFATAVPPFKQPFGSRGGANRRGSGVSRWAEPAADAASGNPAC